MRFTESDRSQQRTVSSPTLLRLSYNAHKAENEENPDAVAIAFDLKTPTFRHKAYYGLQATRKGMPPELASQMAPLIGTSKTVGI